VAAPEALLRHERPLTLAAIAVLVALSWTYLWQGAGMGMSALDMTTFSLFPHRQAGMDGSMETSWWIVALMWWVMMIAMMTPSATPLVLMYGKVLESRPELAASRSTATTLLLAGYLSVWLLFSLAAAMAQKWLEPAGLISGMMLWSRSAALSALPPASAAPAIAPRAAGRSSSAPRSIASEDSVPMSTPAKRTDSASRLSRRPPHSGQSAPDR
jgi:predicted metal-binding membrane protein